MLLDVSSHVEETACNPVPARDDISLVASAKNGDRSAFEILVERHERVIFFTALRITGNREDAQDIVQQSLQKAFVHLKEFEGRSSFSTWLTRIALNEALMLKRSSRRSREVPLDDSDPTSETQVALEMPDARPNPESSYSQRERQRLLLSAMNSLKPGIRKALMICDLDERSTKETAEILGLSVSAVKSRVNRGRRALRERLKRQMLPATVASRARSWRARRRQFGMPQFTRASAAR
ncbi:MAG TPA: sigma-70 family RNA polymerase sigma factor [Candidatus Baltobacteraceae bacterium]|nr:sigma-70 family RNA polymerase sigma factor [Candidatus Baltobacteraceae bacterium]